MVLTQACSASSSFPNIRHVVPRLFHRAACDGSRLRPSRYKLSACCASPAASASSASSMRLSCDVGLIASACSRCRLPTLVFPNSRSAFPRACWAAACCGCCLTRVRICRAPRSISPICSRQRPVRYKASGLFGSCLSAASYRETASAKRPC